jgi:amino acid transporter
MSELSGAGVVAQEDHTKVAVVADTELRAGALKLPAVLMQSVTTVAPAIAILFTVQFIASFAGQAAPVAYFFGFLIALMLAISLAQLAKYLPSAGGYYTYLSRAIHPRFGFLAAWMYFLFLPITPVIISVYLGFVLHDELKAAYDVNIPWWLFVLVCMAAIASVIYRGIAISAKLMVAFGLAEIALVLVLSLWGFFDPGPGGVGLGPLNPGNAPSFHGLYLAVVFSIFAISGWEAAAPIAEESENPRKTIPRALIGSVLIMGAFLILCAWGIVTGWGTADVDGLINSPTLPGFELAHRFWGDLWWLVLLALVNSALAVMIATMNGATRMWYGMGRSGSFPSWLTKLHPSYRTPVNALALQVGIMLAVGLTLGSVWGGSDTFLVTGLVFTLSICAVYTAGNLGVIRFYLRERRSEFNLFLHGIFPVVSAVAVGWVAYKSFTPLPTGRAGYALPIFAVWFGLGLGILLLMRLRGKEEWLLNAGRPVDERVEP